MRNGMRSSYKQPDRKPVRGEVVLGHCPVGCRAPCSHAKPKYVVLAVGLRYADVRDLEPVPSVGKHLIKFQDIEVTGEMMNVD